MKSITSSILSVKEYTNVNLGPKQKQLVEMYQTAEPESVYLQWLGALMGTVLVGLSGLVPMLIIPLEAGQNLKSEKGSRSLRLLLSFAVGGLLGDVFLHLFPESYGALRNSGKNTHTAHLVMGLWILGRNRM